MQKIIFGIFAHPDDETLVCGTLMKMASQGAEINLVVVTDGQAGVNPREASDLGEARLGEWHQAAEMIGARTTHSLHYEDGGLGDDQLSAIAGDVQDLLLGHIATQPGDVQLSLVTFDTDGLTGHSDHQLVTKAILEVFQQLPSALPMHTKLEKLLLYRLSNEQAAAGPTTPAYPLSGYLATDCDEAFDVHEFVGRKKTVMNCHLSQAADMNKWKQLPEELLGVEYFRIVTAAADQE